MNRISTHVLDLETGRPARGMRIDLDEAVSGGWRLLTQGVTDGDGRCSDLLVGDLKTAVYRMTFQTSTYYSERGEPSFFPMVVITFLAAAGTSYHIPLLLSPFGYSTYRGS